ncbi:formylglycine-generating enzyme family protein [Methylocaldum marinum]|nr:formylglycine-generating enzyme family protein [Methylocaldum marinum]
MVRIPGGSFMMGASSGEDGSQDDEGPLHMVRVDGFAIGKYEVTRAQFAAFVDDTGYESSGCYTWNGSKWEEDSSASWRRPGFSQGGDHPVVCVSFEDAEAYTRWLNRKTGKTFRLPTESEWEYAARAGTDAARYWGEDGDDACRYANVGDRTAKQTLQNRTVHDCSDGYVYTAPVGSFKPNRFGLYDVLGNVWEWTCSSYTERYDGSETEYGSSGRRVVRDGSWFDAPEDVRSANRGWSGPTLLFNNLGFRLAHD